MRGQLSKARPPGSPRIGIKGRKSPGLEGFPEAQEESFISMAQCPVQMCPLRAESSRFLAQVCPEPRLHVGPPSAISHHHRIRQAMRFGVKKVPAVIPAWLNHQDGRRCAFPWRIWEGSAERASNFRLKQVSFFVP